MIGSSGAREKAFHRRGAKNIRRGWRRKALTAKGAKGSRKERKEKARASTKQQIIEARAVTFRK
jgi:hypothetical protein